MILAGEASGEQHAADLMQALRRIAPGTTFEFFGSGGARMRQAGADILIDVNQVSIIGPVEILKAWRSILQAFRTLKQAARERQPDAVILIDWPEFNLKILKFLKQIGRRTIYYISPQIWAWRRYRLRTIKRYVDKMIVILPFEVDFYRRAGLEVEFVGHPLVETVRATKDRTAFCAEYQLDPQRPIISFLPGSRRSEVTHIFPVMLEAMLRLRSSGAQFVVPLAHTIARAWVQAMMRRRHRSVALTFIEQNTYNAVAHSELAVVASGTATLETALLETPLIVVYRSSALNYCLIRPLIHLDTFGMVNLIAGEKIAPELIQFDMTPERLADTIRGLLQDQTARAIMKEKLKQIKRKLGDGNAAERAARIVIQTIGNVAYLPTQT